MVAKFWLTFFISLLIFNTLFSQNWESLGDGMSRDVYALYNDTLEQVLYIGGQFHLADNEVVNGIAEWDGQSFKSVGSGNTNCFNDACQRTLAFIRYQGNLYCSPQSDNVSGVAVAGLARWDGDLWSSVGEGLFSGDGITAGQVNSTLIHNDELYIFGSFKFIGQDTAYSAAKWDGTSLSSLNFQYNFSTSNRIFEAIVFNDEIYVAGFVLDNQGEPIDVLRFDGQNWHMVGGGIKGFSDDPYKFIIYKDELYVGGNFRESSGNAGTGIMKLENGEWVDVGGSFDFENPSFGILSMVVYEDELYVFGKFDSVAGGIKANNIAKWDGEKWCGFPNEITKKIITAEVYNNEIYIGGSFDSIDGNSFNKIARWVGNYEVDTCGDFSSSTETNFTFDVQVELSPNPAFDFLNLSIRSLDEGGNLELSISNLFGKTIHQERLFSINKNFSHSMDISFYPSGVYFVTIHFGGKYVTKKLIISR